MLLENPKGKNFLTYKRFEEEVIIYLKTFTNRVKATFPKFHKIMHVRCQHTLKKF